MEVQKLQNIKVRAWKYGHRRPFFKRLWSLGKQTKNRQMELHEIKSLLTGKEAIDMGFFKVLKEISIIGLSFMFVAYT